jgi:hypothetical protein
MQKSLWRTWFPRAGAGRPGTKSAFRPSFEGLEDRVVPDAGSISGHVFLDRTGNGVSPDDTAHSGVTVRLFQDTNLNGVKDTGDVQVASQPSGPDGSYSFANLAPGTYFVNESTPSGFVRTAPASSSYYTVNLASGQAVGGQDFANFQKLNKSVVTNVSFTVIAPDGSQTVVTDLRGHTQQGDTVVANFTIAASAGGPTVVSLVSYDAPGSSFVAADASQQNVDLVASDTFQPGQQGSLSVRIPSNFFQVDFILGQAIDHFGPAGSNVFYSAQGRLVSADNGGTQAFVDSSLSGTVFVDNSASGTPNAGATNVFVTLTGTNDLGQTVNVSVPTDSNGNYTFAGLRPGTYTLTVSNTPTLTGESATVGTIGSQPGSGTPSAGTISGITLTGGSVGAGYDFLELPATGST